jgi:hypothetical protein
VRWDEISFLVLCWLLGVAAWHSSKPFLPSSGGYRCTYCYQSNTWHLLHILAPSARKYNFLHNKRHSEDMQINYKITTRVTWCNSMVVHWQTAKGWHTDQSKEKAEEKQKF